MVICFAQAVISSGSGASIDAVPVMAVFNNSVTPSINGGSNFQMGTSLLFDRAMVSEISNTYRRAS